jgi:S-formylglutathione hydrolase
VAVETISKHASFGGTTGFYRHASSVNSCTMQFAVFTPPQAADGPVPVLTYLAGLTCSEETFMIKAGAQRVAAELGIMLVAPDTSPRGEDVPDDADGAWDFGLGAGFYLNATEAPWSQHYRMYDYVTAELPAVVGDSFPADLSRQGITGHSMGGHGALTIGLKNPDLYRSVSAFAPICSPVNCPWGQKAFSHYLGDDHEAWRNYDASELVRSLDRLPDAPVLIDQGTADQFLEQELKPELLEAACAARNMALELRRHEDYDHGYYFISTFIEDHLRHHASILAA